MEELKTEATRHLIDQAIAVGRSYQSPQTGFIHYNVSLPNSTQHQTIPVYENALFALALFRTRLMDNIKEGQSLIAKLLAFQNEQGNFPVYLHEYPNCRDFTVGIRMLAPFYWILKGFGHVLGHDLREQLETSIQKIIADGIDAHQNNPFPFSLAVRFAAKIDENMLQDLMKSVPDMTLHSTSYLADLLVAMQMTNKNPDEAPWNQMWAFIQQTWHRQLACYCGPDIRETQDTFEPTVGLYDLFLGVLSGSIGHRTERLKIDHLQGALIHPFANGFPTWTTSSLIKGTHEDQAWMSLIENDWALTLMEKTVPLSEKRERTFTPIKVIWGNLEKVHSLVCQGIKGVVKYDWKEDEKNVIDLFFDLDHLFEGGNSEKSREICFYFDIHPGVKVLVGEQQATTFALGQKMVISFDDGKNIAIQLDLLEGEGEFLGHVAQMNRPTQINQGEDKRFEVYDWTLFLRTLRRKENCKLRARIELKF